MWTSDLHEALPKRQFDTVMVFSTVVHRRPYVTPFSRTGLFLEPFSPAKIEAFLRRCAHCTSRGISKTGTFPFVRQRYASPLSQVNYGHLRRRFHLVFKFKLENQGRI